MDAYLTRIGAPGATYALSLDDGTQVTLETDSDGRAFPGTALEAAIADHHGLAIEAPTKGRKARSTDSAPADPAQEA